MSLSIQRSVVEQFNFNGKDVRSVYVRGEGVLYVYRAVGYIKEAGIKAVQRLVPEKYKMRISDLVHLHQDTILSREPGLYCFLLRCGKDKAKSFLK